MYISGTVHSRWHSIQVTIYDRVCMLGVFGGTFGNVPPDIGNEMGYFGVFAGQCP